MFVDNRLIRKIFFNILKPYMSSKFIDCPYSDKETP